MRFLIKEYGAEAVAFDTASGDTHYLAPLALAAFKLAATEPAHSWDAVRQALAGWASSTGTASAVEIDDTLASLRRIGLVAAP